MSTPRRFDPLLAMILLLALALRCVGLSWGLPNALHTYSYHPDESLILAFSLPEFGGINPLAGRFLPHYYNYGSLPFTLDNLVVTLASAYHLIGPIRPHGVIDTAAFARAYLAARWLSALFGVGSVWATYAVGRRLYDRRAGVLGALLLAVTPLHAQHSHFATVDVQAGFWLLLSLVWSARLLAPERGGAGEARAALLAGVFAGLAAATKYSGILVLLALAAAAALRARSGTLTPARAALLIAAGGSAAAGAFVAACPGCVLEPGLFLQGVAYESNHVMHQGEVYFQQTGSGWLYVIDRNLDAGMGLPLLLAALAGGVYAAVRRAPGDALLAAVALPTYLLVGAAQSRYARYEIPLLPLLTVWAARLLVAGSASAAAAASPLPLPASTSDAARRRGLASLSRLRPLAPLLAGLLVAFTLADTALLIAPMIQRDPRDRAAEYIATLRPAPARIGFGSRPWFWSAAVNPAFSDFAPGGWQAATPPALAASYCYPPADAPVSALDPAVLAACRADVVTLSEYEYYDPLRLRRPAAAAYVAALRAGYAPPRVFRDLHPLGGRSEIGGLPTQDLPTDMLYPSPTILVYSRRAGNAR